MNDLKKKTKSTIHDFMGPHPTKEAEAVFRAAIKQSCKDQMELIKKADKL